MYIEFLPGQKHAAKGADTSDDINAFNDCGYLLTKEDVIIDIDSIPKETIKTMLAWFNITTKRVWTDRGVHLYFKKPLGFTKAKNGVCQLGFPVEMKTIQNTPNGITVKRNGVVRETENEDTIQELPLIFNDRKQYESLLGLGEGDGRNNALYIHKMKLGNCEGWQTILNFINQHIFDEPMDVKELETVIREQAVDTTQVNEYLIANEIINTYKTVKYGNKIWWYDGTKYVSTSEGNELVQIIYNRVGNRPTKFVDEIRKQIDYRSKIIKKDTFAIKFLNGVLDTDGAFEEVDYTEFTPYFVNINYYPDAAPVEIVDDYLDKLTNGDPEYKKLLQQVLGFSFVTDPEKIRSLGKFFMFRGDGRNGKGTLLQIIQTILNKDNCTNMSIKQMSDHTFYMSMIGKLANLGDDIEPEAINNDQMKMLKNITTADDIEGRQMYKEGRSIQICAKLYFTTNADIRSFEKGYAYKRRVLWLPMFNKVEKVDPYFISKITTQESLEYWIRLLVEGCQTLLKEGWTECAAVKQYNDEYHENNNPMLLFINDIDVDALENKTITEIRGMFEEWKDDEAYKFSSKLFKQTIWEKCKMGITKMNTKRVLVKASNTTQNLKPR